MKVLLVDDHVLFREGMTFMLSKLAETVEILEAASYVEALSMANNHRDLDLILLDFVIPGATGLKEVAKFQKAWRSTPIVVVSGLASNWDIAQSFRLGVLGYIPKTYSSSEMLSALREVLDGERFLPPDQADKISSLLEDQYETGNITSRQREVLTLLAQGMTNKQIARELDISYNTVRVYLSRIFQILSVSTRTEAIFAAKREGILNE